MSVSPFSRYRNLDVLEVQHSGRGKARSLPIRRAAGSSAMRTRRQHRFADFESADLLALKFFRREDLFWHLLDANDGRLPDSFEPGEMLNVPALSLATRVDRSGR